MKKEYMKPMMESEVFVANEYVATCSKSEHRYELSTELLSCISCSSDCAMEQEFERLVALVGESGTYEDYNDNESYIQNIYGLLAIKYFSKSEYGVAPPEDDNTLQVGKVIAMTMIENAHTMQVDFGSITITAS